MTQYQDRDELGRAVSSATTAEQGMTGAGGFAPPLGDMSADEFRRHGRAVVDWIGGYFERVEKTPAPGGSRSRLDRGLFRADRRTPGPRASRAGRAHLEASSSAARNRGVDRTDP